MELYNIELPLDRGNLVLIIRRVRILVIEDSDDLSFLLKEALSDQYVVDLATDLDNAYRLLDTEAYDLLVLDLFFPEGHGLNFCQKIRNEGFEAPILFLTGDISLDSKVKALDAGGDDYLTKPFNLSELKARIKVLLRRRDKIFIKNQLCLKDLDINYQTREVSKDGSQLKLTRKEFMLFDLLLKNPKKIFSRKQIATSVWDDDKVLFGNSIESHVGSIRRKIGHSSIKTIRGVGYCFGEI